MENVDLVYLWVTSDDPIYKEEREKALRTTWRGRDKTAIANYRSTDNGELELSLHSALLFAPWIRKIHIVVSLGQRPKFPITDERVQFVDDVHIMPEKAIPCFNSHAFEANLHRIPGLSEQFLYANDDEFFGAPVTPSDFFEEKSGLPRMCGPGEPLPPPGKRCYDFFPGWYSGRCNTSTLLHRIFGPVIPPRREAKHQIRPLLKSVFEQMWGTGLIRRELEATTLTPFRHSTNVDPVGLAMQVGKTWGRAGPDNLGLRTRYVSWYDKTDWDYEGVQLMLRRPHLFCINDEQVQHLRKSAEVMRKTVFTFLRHSAETAATEVVTEE